MCQDTYIEYLSMSRKNIEYLIVSSQNTEILSSDFFFQVKKRSEFEEKEEGKDIKL
jgi:hypothetical protein